MPTAKFTVFINAAVQNTLPASGGTAESAGATVGLGGISESWYSTLGYNSTELFAIVQEYCRLRAKLLPNVCAIVARRYQEVGSKGKVILTKKTDAGSADTIGDIPQMALRTKCHSRTTGAERAIVLGAIPDARVSRGTYLPSTAFQNNLNALLAFIKTNCLLRAIDQTVPTYSIASVSELGLITTNEVNAIAAGDIVQVMSTRDGKWRARGGYFKVASKPTTSSLLLEFDKWPYDACVEGKVRKHVTVYEQVDIYDADYTNPTATVRKFGRPFGLFRGRASTKQ